jgi:hypothetical protein
MLKNIPLLIVEHDKDHNHVAHHKLSLKRVIASGGYTEILRYTGFRNAQLKRIKSKITWYYCHLGQQEINLYFESFKNVGIITKDRNYYKNFIKNMPVVKHKDLNSFFKAIGYEWSYKKRKKNK